MVVRIGGLVCPEIVEIEKICDEHGLFLIEDAAHAHGSKIGDRCARSFGTAGAFSFYSRKVITSGEGGIVTTNWTDVASIAAVLRNQGKENFSGNNIM